MKGAAMAELAARCASPAAVPKGRKRKPWNRMRAKFARTLDIRAAIRERLRSNVSGGPRQPRPPVPLLFFRSGSRRGAFSLKSRHLKRSA
jgi:hypothetical protein